MSCRTLVVLLLATSLFSCSKKPHPVFDTTLDESEESQTQSDQENPDTNTTPIDLGKPASCNDGLDNDGDGLVDWQYDLGCSSQDDDSEGDLANDTVENGWSVFEAAADTIIYYVSSSTGNDLNSGLTPDDALQSYAAARLKTGAGRADWILLKRGDTFFESLDIPDGRSAAEPFVVASYGAEQARPVLKTGSDYGINKVNEFAHIRVIGLDFYAHTRNPNDADYSNADGEIGLRLYRSNHDIGSDILVEDCVFRYYATGAVIQGASPPNNIRLRRNHFEYNYSIDSHAQGVYAKGVEDFLFEGNLLYHNGWLVQSINSDNDQTDGQATIYNHSTYFNGINTLSYRDNISIKPSSMGSKFTAETTAAAQHYVIDNNLYLDGELGIRIGDNYSGAANYRFLNIEISRNVMLDIGYSQPTNRRLGWGLTLEGLDSANIHHNLHLGRSKPEVSITYSLLLHGVQRDIEIHDNTFYAIDGDSNRALMQFNSNGLQRNITINNNILALDDVDRYLVEIDNNDSSNLSFSSNRYELSSLRDLNRWFRINDIDLNLDSWISAVSEFDAQNPQLNFCDTSRDIPSYMASLGHSASDESFIAQIRQQQKFYWSEKLEASVINDWFREGFALCP